MSVIDIIRTASRGDLALGIGLSAGAVALGMVSEQLLMADTPPPTNVMAQLGLGVLGVGAAAMGVVTLRTALKFAARDGAFQLLGAGGLLLTGAALGGVTLGAVATASGSSLFSGPRAT